MNWYIWYSPLKDSLKLLLKIDLTGIWTHDHIILFRRSTRLSYQAMSSTRTQSQLSTATPISLFVQCQISFRQLPSSVGTFLLIEIFLRQLHESSGMNWWTDIYINIYIYIHIYIHIYTYIYIYIYIG